MKSLLWPVVALLIIGGLHFVEETVLFKAGNPYYVSATIGPILLAVGVWLGYRTAQTGGNLVSVLINGAIAGLLPLMLDIVGFGLILGRPSGLEAGVFGWSMIFFGSLIGGGFSLTKSPSGI